MIALVTGGGGFLGGQIVRQLLAQGDTVRTLSRGTYSNLAALGVDQRQGDLDDLHAVESAVHGVDIVYHVAAKAGVWGPVAEYHRVNVVGTRNVLAACRSQGVAMLVFTSTPSVVYHGGDLEGADESTPYPPHYETAYAQTKAEAERMVLSANSPTLATVALRPHLIWGVGDPHLVPRVIARARAGKLRIVGRGTNRVDVTYVDDAARAHLQAAQVLVPGSAVAGRAYFLSQGEPVELWPFLNRVLATVGLPPVVKRVPYSVAWTGGALLEMAYRVMGKRDEPPMTRFVARQLATSHWFDISAARRDFGYAPAVQVDEGLKRLREESNDFSI